MSKGILYVMTTAVPGLIKIGKTGSKNFEQRMYNLEHDGYRNVTALKRTFAIDVNIVIQLLSSFDGNMVYPISKTKDEIFDQAADDSTGKLIPDGKYTFRRKKKSDGNKLVKATAIVQNGSWTLLKGSILGVYENAGVSKKARKIRMDLPLDENGKLLEDFCLGECSPSFAGTVVLNASNDGWIDWKNKDGNPVDIYRVKETDE